MQIDENHQFGFCMKGLSKCENTLVVLTMIFPLRSLYVHVNNMLVCMFFTCTYYVPSAV